MKVRQLTVEQKDQLAGQTYDGVQFFNPTQDADGNWFISNEEVTLEVFAEEIGGIVYYIDKFKYVYKTDDVLQAKMNPTIIAKWAKNGDRYTIPEFGLV